MRFRRQTTWILVLLLISTTVAALSAFAQDAQARPPVHEIQVAVGGQQDRVHYAGYAETQESADATPERKPHAMVFEMNGMGETISRAGQVVDALVLQQRYTLDGRPLELAWAEYVDLSSRTLVRYDAVGERPAGDGYWADSASSFFRSSQGISNDVAWQGRTLTLGQEIAGPDCDDLLEDYTPTVTTTRTWVSDAGWYDGKPALAMRTEEITHDNGQSFEYSYTAMRWFVEGQAYPVLIEEWYDDLGWLEGKRDEAENWRSHEVFTLVATEAAGDPVPWKASPSNPCADAALPSAPRSESPVPSDADSTLWAYAPSAAIRDVRSSPEFVVWSLQHADSKLIGFGSMIGNDVRPVPQADDDQWWVLTFASGVDAIRFTSEKPRTAAPAIVQKVSEFTVPDTSAWLIPDPVTLGHVQEMWERFNVKCTQPWPSLYWGATLQEESELNEFYFEHIAIACRTDTFEPMRQASKLPSTAIDLDFTWLSVSTASGGLLYHTSVFFSGSSMLPLPAVAGDSVAPAAIEARRVDSVAIPAAALWVSSTVVIVLLAILVGKFLSSGAFAGYAKIRNDELLDHPLREAVRSHVQHNPGIDPPSLQGRLGVPWSTLTYHLSVMERDRLLISNVVGRHKHLFLPNVTPARQRAGVATLQNEQTRRIFETIAQQPGSHQRALARQFGIDPKAVTWHLRRLAAAGLVTSVQEGRKTRWSVAPEPTSPN